jgi:UDP-N-acetylmuramate-alanine ligase
LALADRIVIGPVFTKPQDPVDAADLFSPAELTEDLQTLSKQAHAGQGTDEIRDFLATNCSAGDVVLFMSNGAFGGLPRKLLSVLSSAS